MENNSTQVVFKNVLVAKGDSRFYTEYSGGGFFRNCDIAYYIRTGCHIVNTLPENDRNKGILRKLSRIQRAWL